MVPPTLARSFAASGSVAAAVAQSLKDQQIDLRGIACKTAILEGCPYCRLDANFVEGMACDIGCVAVPDAGCVPKSKASPDAVCQVRRTYHDRERCRPVRNSRAINQKSKLKGAADGIVCGASGLRLDRNPV